MYKAKLCKSVWLYRCDSFTPTVRTRCSAVTSKRKMAFHALSGKRHLKSDSCFTFPWQIWTCEFLCIFTICLPIHYIYICRWPVTQQYCHNLCSIFDCMNTYTLIRWHTGSGTYLWSKWWIERITPEFKWACFKVTRIVNSYLFLNFWKKISAVSGDAFTLLEVSKRKCRKTLSIKYYFTLQIQIKEFTK